MKSLAQQLIEENIRTQNPYLDLGLCGLDGTEPELTLLEECVWLRELVFSNMWYELDEVDENGEWQDRQSQNKGERNQFIQVPPFLPKGLQKLVMGGLRVSWQISDISSLSRLSNLTLLNISCNNICDISPLSELSSLTSLNLGDNQVSDISPLSGLNSLISLRLWNNQILDISPLSGLSRLTLLLLIDNQISNISPLSGLRNLTLLGINNNQISDISPISKLSNLTLLAIGSNQISDISPLSGLSSLTSLNLENNRISDISPLSGLSSLTLLYLWNNQISNISLEFLNQFPHLQEFGIQGNPIQNIPKEIFNKGTNVLQEVRDYLESVAIKNEAQELNEAKLIIVGVGEIGKSELAEALSEAGYTFVEGRKTTAGIRIKQWDLVQCEREGKTFTFRVNIWDFAGQEINYGTHQFFLTKNSLYLFVWETRKGEQQSKFDYWLNVVSLLSENAPILVVQSKIDVYEDEISNKDWKAKFPNIRDFHKTSCKTGAGIDRLRTSIQTELLAIPHTRELWNKHRVAIRELLEAKAEDYISYKEYVKICEEHTLNKEQAGFLVKQLHDLGVLLHYAEDTRLKDTVVLKTSWGTDAAYALLDTKKIKGGRFEERQLADIWQDDRFDDKHGFLLELMKKFELIFQLQDKETYIIPEGLPIDAPPAAEALLPDAQYLRFEYHYHFMPKGILSRFICRIHHHIQQELFWRYGVVLQYEGSQARVVLNEVSQVLKVEAWGSKGSTLLAIIRSQIDQIHEKLKNPSLEEMIPCYCVPCKENKTHFFGYDYLSMCSKEGDTELRCSNKSKVSIKKLLEGISDPREGDIKHLISLIDDWQIAEFFEALDRMGIVNPEFSQLNQEFVQGNRDPQYAFRLKVCVNTYFRRR